MTENYDPNKVSRVVLIDPTANNAAYAATGVGSFSGAVTAGAGDMVDEATIAAAVGPRSALNVADTNDHLLHTGAVTLHSVILNTAAGASTLKAYDGTTAGGTLLATVSGTGTTPQVGDYNIHCAVGLFVKATGTADWTVTYVV